MDLHDEFEVSLPVAKAWAVLTDVEKIAPCLPGIWLREVAGEDYQGVAKVKVGPITASYEGVARYLLRDADVYKAVLKAEGHEIHGQGKGSALVTATLSPSVEGTRVEVVTVLSIDGRLALVPKSALAAMSRKLIAEFAKNLEVTVLAAPEAVAASPVVEAHTAVDDKAPAELSSEKFTEVPTDPEPSTPEICDEQIHPLTGEPEAKQESLIRRLAPYLTIAGFLLIARIVSFSLRRSQR